jgi:hypothetical protein
MATCGMFSTQCLWLALAAGDSAGSAKRYPLDQRDEVRDRIRALILDKGFAAQPLVGS